MVKYFKLSQSYQFTEKDAPTMPIYHHEFECRGSLLLINGPSGSGKTTVLKILLQMFPKLLVESVSFTTRWPPRPNETMLRDYVFVDDDRFQWMEETSQFIETTYFSGSGFHYGTSAYELETHWRHGFSVVIAVDTHGVDNYYELGLDPKVVFFDITDEEEQRRRMRSDRQESDEAIESRVAKAREERQWAEAASAEDKILYLPNLTIEESVELTTNHFSLEAG